MPKLLIMFNSATFRISSFLCLFCCGNALAQNPFSLTITGPGTCVAPLVGTSYTGTMGTNGGGCTMLLWTIEPYDAGTFLAPDGTDTGTPCVFVAENACGFPSEIPVYEGDQFGCDKNVQVMPNGFTSHTVSVRWIKDGSLKLKLLEKGTGGQFTLTASLNVNVLPETPTGIVVNSSSNSQVNMTATFPAGATSCSNLAFRWRVSTCGGAFSDPITTPTPNFTLVNNFCNCNAVVRVSSVVGSGPTMVESPFISRTFPKVIRPSIAGPLFLCKGTTTNFTLTGIPAGTVWQVDAPASIVYSDDTQADVYLPDGNFTIGVNLGVTGSYACGNFTENRFLTIPDKPCVALAPDKGYDLREASLAPVPNIKISPTLVRSGGAIGVELPYSPEESTWFVSMTGIDGKIYHNNLEMKETFQLHTDELPAGYYKMVIRNAANIMVKTTGIVVVD